MNHLTDEQFEGIIQGTQPEPDHLNECVKCRERLIEKRALAKRLRSAFTNTKPNPNLSQSIRSQINRTKSTGVFSFRAHKKTWAAAISAAAAILMIIPLALHLSSTSTTTAAQQHLIDIHTSNSAKQNGFYTEADPEKLAKFFKENLGFDPYLPKLNKGMALRGCCVKHFQGKIAGSYVVDTPEGIISIIVVTDTPASLGISGKLTEGNQTFAKSSYAMCEMVSIRIGDYTYCAVGEPNHKYLANLLKRLLPNE